MSPDPKIIRFFAKIILRPYLLCGCVADDFHIGKKPSPNVLDSEVRVAKSLSDSAAVSARATDGRDASRAICSPKLPAAKPTNTGKTATHTTDKPAEAAAQQSRLSLIRRLRLS